MILPDVNVLVYAHRQDSSRLIADTYLAALAFEAGAEWITTDRDYARFSGLCWRHPLT